jgi:hypothetical protein
VASEETIARATIQLGADGSKLAPEMAAAVAKAQAILDGANKKAEREAAKSARAIQAAMNSINAVKPARDMETLASAVQKLGGTANLTREQLSRVTLEVNRLAAAGAKVPASLSGLTGIGSKLGAVFQSLGTGGGFSGALAAIGPAGLAASAGIGAVTLAGGAAFRAIKDLASEAERWSNIAASTGLGVTEVQQLSALLEDAGIPAEALTMGFKRMQQEIAGGGAALAKFGIKVADLKDMSPEEQFRALAERIAAIEDPAERTAAAIAAFGRSGQELIPVLDKVATGADKMFGALSGSQIEDLKRADDAIDRYTRKLELLGKQALVTGLQLSEMALFPVELGRSLNSIGDLPKVKPNKIFQPPSLKVPGGPTLAEQERERQLDEVRKESLAKAKKAADEAADAEKKLAEARAKFAAKVKAQTSDRMIEEMAGLVTMKDLLKVAPGAKKGGTAAAMVDQFTGSRLPSETLSGQLAAEAEAAQEAEDRTQKLIDTFGSLSSQLTNLSQNVGGFAGKLLGIAASLSSGAGGIFSGIKAFKDAGKSSGFLGILGKVSSSFGIIGAGIGVVGGIVGGLKKLFGGKSKEQKAADKAAKDQAEASARQTKIDAARSKEQGLLSAKGGAESLMDRLEKGGLSAGLTTALQTIIGKVGDALLRSGLGILDARLKKSDKFQESQGIAGDTAQVIAGMSQGGMFDASLQAAGGEVAKQVHATAVDAAREAGLGPEEATKAGFAAVAPLLREQLNAAIRSGRELDANTQALLEEAKRNGIEILADPAIESLGVQREQLAVLQQIAGMPVGGGSGGGGGGGGQASGGSGAETGGVTGRGGGGDVGDFIPRWDQDIPRFAEGAHIKRPMLAIVGDRPERIIPDDAFRMASGSGASFPVDLPRNSGAGGSSGGRGVSKRAQAGTSITMHLTEDPYHSAEGRLALRRRTIQISQREANKHLSAQIQAGKA